MGNNKTKYMMLVLISHQRTYWTYGTIGTYWTV